MAKSNPKYVLNLKAIFDEAYSDKSKEFRSKLRPILREPQFRLFLAQNLIERIQKNTSNGKDKDGDTISSYAPYSKGYKKSLAFKVYGKTSKVNLTLTGEMLSSVVRSKRSDGNELVLQFEGAFNILKAAVHINGSSKKNIPQRDFFGLPKEQEVSIFKSAVVDYIGTNLRDVIDEEKEVLSAVEA